MRRHVWLELGYWAGGLIVAAGIWRYSATCGIIALGALLIVSAVVTAIAEGRAMRQQDQEPKG